MAGVVTCAYTGLGYALAKLSASGCYSVIAFFIF
jgi:hypothetical protein